MDLTTIIAGIGIFTIILLSIILLIKNVQVGRYKENFAKLKKSFNELDDQAKLIVKTDLELNKAQEESDKRLNGLDALQKTSRMISTTLVEEEIFQRLNQSLLVEMGFEKNLLIVYGPNKELNIKVNLGFPQESLRFIQANLAKDIDLLKTLDEGHIFSSANAPKQRQESILRIFQIKQFVLSPILTQHGSSGALFVGNQSNTATITEGDEEIVSILASQIGQALENARLFEEVYQARQALESKVNERTKQLATALKEVQNISKTKSEFISAVSHELRTPLTSIKGYASILMDGKLGNVPDQVKERLGKINIHSDNLVNLINNLLDISRIESGRVEMNFSKSHLSHIIENIHDLLTPQMKAKNINWVVDVSGRVPETFLDVSQIERVFINLVGNAIKFTPEGGTIAVKATLADNTINVDVSDTGIGISPEDIGKLFHEFYRVENQINQNVKGTGLGLALAKKIVEAHDGRMWVTSKVNEGTTFHFTLPVITQSTKRDRTP